MERSHCVWAPHLLRLRFAAGGATHDRLFVKFFTESLILAQDERWRRA